MRTVDGILYESFREAAHKLGLLKDDNEWNIALTEASSTQTNVDLLRDLFCVILIHCQPSNPKFLWDTHKEALSSDIKYKYNNNKDRYTVNHIYEYCLYLIDIKVRNKNF